MRRRTLVLLSLLPLVTVLGMVGLYFDGQREGRVSRANAERICVGMTEAEVERLLGRPGTTRRKSTLIIGPRSWCTIFQEWRSPFGDSIWVRFENGVVDNEPSYSRSNDFWVFDWLWDRLGL